MDDSEWQPIETAPEDVEVMTKIDDGRGMRNEAPLRRQGNLWYIVSHQKCKHCDTDRDEDVMYVYYRPTHWRPTEAR